MSSEPTKDHIAPDRLLAIANKSTDLFNEAESEHFRRCPLCVERLEAFVTMTHRADQESGGDKRRA